MRISNSKAKTFWACHKQYHYKYVRNLRPIAKSYYLEFGSWMHDLIDVKYSGGNWRKRHKQLTKEFRSMPKSIQGGLGDLPRECGRKMLAYEYHWREPDQDYEVVATELEFDVDLPHGHVMTGKIDKITRDDMGLWIWETKTKDRIPDPEDRLKDMQISKYNWALTRIEGFEDEEVIGVVWDYVIRKPATKPRLLKDKTGLYKRKINTDLLTFVSALREYDLDEDDYRDTIEQLKSDTKFFTRIELPINERVMKINVRDLVYTADEIERGDWKPVHNLGLVCNSCDFKRLCMVEMIGGDAQGVIDAHYMIREKGGDNGDQEKEEEVIYTG